MNKACTSTSTSNDHHQIQHRRACMGSRLARRVSTPSPQPTWNGPLLTLLPFRGDINTEAPSKNVAIGNDSLLLLSPLGHYYTAIASQLRDVVSTAQGSIRLRLQWNKRQCHCRAPDPPACERMVCTAQWSSNDGRTDWTLNRSHIIISSRSPLKNYWQDYRVEFVAVDFLDPVDTIVEKLSPMCDKVTHAYFTSYVHTDDFSKLREYNVPLFENFLTSIDKVAGDSLQRICLQTGGKVRVNRKIST